MPNNLSRYQLMEQYMTYALLADAALFVIYLVIAALGVIWLKIVLAVLACLLSVVCLAYLFLTKELLRKRSLWMSAAAAAVLVCTIISLILNFPAPKVIP